MSKEKKTNAARLLERDKIPYELIPYPCDEAHLGVEHVAAELHEDLERVFKTIVMKGDKTGLLVFVVPGNAEVNLKKAAKVSGNKKVEPLHLKELLPATGYVRGGCSPIGMKKHYPTYYHLTAVQFDCIYVSAGERGKQIKINPSDLIKVTEGTVADFAEMQNSAP